MSRTSRQPSSSGIYHVILRGINQQQIFEDEEDKQKLLDCLQAYKDICGFQLHAYCIMGNHLHLLIEEGNEKLSQIIKRVATRFVYWYNLKYQRSGHLFQDRFMSEPVEDDAYFITVVRYIHLNPVKAGICPTPDGFKYSSYHAYVGKECSLVDTDLVLSMMSKEEFLHYHSERSDDSCLEHQVPARISEADAIKMLKRISGYINASDIQKLEIPERDKVVRELKEAGLSVRRISRLTGVSKTVVGRV